MGYEYFVAYVQYPIFLVVHVAYSGPQEKNFKNTYIVPKYRGFTFRAAEQPPRQDRARSFKHAPALQ
jgi:hypothetical protein